MKRLLTIFISWGIFMTGCSNDDTITGYSGESCRVNSQLPYTYTIYRDLHGCDCSTVLYYFHGKGGNAATWFDSNKDIISEWRKTGKPSPVVVGISFGERWLLIPKNPVKEKSGYLELFVNKIMPHIEKQLGISVSHRYVMGFSMGGANAAQLIFRYPELFEKGILVAPNIFPISIFSDPAIIDEFARSENSRIPGLRHWIEYNIFKNDRLKDSVYMHFEKFKKEHIPDSETWDKTDILLNMKKPPSGKTIKIFISCGDSDYNGFYPGARKLAETADSYGYEITWRPFKGGHEVRNKRDIAAFLIK